MTADHAGQTGGERTTCSDCGRWLRATQYEERVSGLCLPCLNGLAPPALSRPVPVPGQAAREAAVEAVARRVAERQGTSWDEYTRGERTLPLEDARELVDIVVAALSAAPGQEPAHEWNCPSCGATTRARMADHPGQEQP